MSDENIRRILRAQAWERAKGELMAMLQTFVGENAQYEQASEHARAFIEHMEISGLCE